MTRVIGKKKIYLWIFNQISYLWFFLNEVADMVSDIKRLKGNQKGSTLKKLNF